jgi:non-heme chloroperoxidase
MSIGRIKRYGPEETMTYVEVEDGVRLFVADSGDADDGGGTTGRPVVLLAGFGMDHSVWARQAEWLAAGGHRVLRVDLRGHGRSDKPRAGYEVERLAQDLRTVLREL